MHLVPHTDKKKYLFFQRSTFVGSDNDNNNKSIGTRMDQWKTLVTIKLFKFQYHMDTICSSQSAVQDNCRIRMIGVKLDWLILICRHW